MTATTARDRLDRLDGQPPAHATCPSCAQPVVVGHERLLTPEPVRLGIYRADGTSLAVTDLYALVNASPDRTAGYGPHECAAPAQPDLFTTQEAHA